MRLFVALDLPWPARERLASLGGGIPGARWTPPENLHMTLRFIGEAKGPENKEWWTEVRRAWEIALDTGKISLSKTKGVRCTNVSWGQ